ncbi:hypothetical protein BU16DRAFT_522398 [Lophium mytilinum]|uniref:Uncharacterized protein n=1 Tax=Lophium mytilinum TaxID=390894 RepID=A0A6A6RDB6_9PEZI|nr:hypothetical protein BU16DRAFT_522398 [Lophium mytilinum]
MLGKAISSLHSTHRQLEDTNSDFYPSISPKDIKCRDTPTSSCSYLLITTCIRITLLVLFFPGPPYSRLATST